MFGKERKDMYDASRIPDPADRAAFIAVHNMYEEQRKSSEELLGIRRRDKIRNGVVYAVSFFLFNGAFFFLTWFMGLFDALGDGEWSFTTHLRMWIISALYIAALFGSAKLVMKLGLVRDADEAEDWEK